MKYLIMKTKKEQENVGKTTESDYVSVNYSQLKKY